MVAEQIRPSGPPEQGVKQRTDVPAELKPRVATPLMMPVVIPVYLDAQDEEECLKLAVEEIIDEWWEDVDAAFPDGKFGVENPLKARDRFNLYMQRTDPRDVPHLLLPDFPELFKAGLEPIPLSPYWAAYWREMPREAARRLKDFVRLYNRYGSDTETQDSASEQP